MAEIAKTFEKEANQLVANIVMASNSGLWDEAIKHLHTLKGSARTVGLDDLGNQARKLEVSIKDDKIRDLQFLKEDLTLLENYLLDYKNYVRNKFN